MKLFQIYKEWRKDETRIKKELEEQEKCRRLERFVHFNIDKFAGHVHSEYLKRWSDYKVSVRNGGVSLEDRIRTLEKISSEMYNLLNTRENSHDGNMI